MSVIDPPSNPPDATWFQRAFHILFASQQSGTTAQRPTTNLWVGRPYFDTTLNLPVWVKTLSPVVWQDAAGNTV